MGWVTIRGVKISTDIFTTYFSCDYERCKGACCWAKNEVPTVGGALTSDEYKEIMKEALRIEKYVSPDMRKKFSRSPTLSWDNASCKGEHLYAMNNYRGGPCLLSRMDKNCCALELMTTEGNGLSFSIPVLCSLYPLLWDGTTKTLELSHLWDNECEGATEKGTREKMFVWKFVEPSIRRLLGDDFYIELEEYAKKYAECLSKTFK